MVLYLTLSNFTQNLQIYIKGAINFKFYIKVIFHVKSYTHTKQTSFSKEEFINFTFSVKEISGQVLNQF